LWTVGGTLNPSPLQLPFKLWLVPVNVSFALAFPFHLPPLSFVHLRLLNVGRLGVSALDPADLTRSSRGSSLRRRRSGNKAPISQQKGRKNPMMNQER
jgi:hypothetical protein